MCQLMRVRPAKVGSKSVLHLSAAKWSVPVTDVEDDIDVPPGKALLACLETHRYWMVYASRRTCPGCGQAIRQFERPPQHLQD
jgi:hypothetical protein